MDKTELKEGLIEAGKAHVEGKIFSVQKAIDDLEDALKLETKCSMGDKYETGRAMLHLEFEKLAVQMEELKKLKKTLSLVPSKKLLETVTFGSVVITSQANYFVAIPAGKFVVNSEEFFAVGANAPVAKALLSHQKGDEVIFNGNSITIKDVF
ncbi:transcription elongation factor [Salinimicrobium soli]|uniref:transcription elongation factor n=1 Tax=Salinimicrobium soli TaxID=1254399 RepID=UPI003AAE2A12